MTLKVFHPTIVSVNAGNASDRAKTLRAGHMNSAILPMCRRSTDMMAPSSG